MMPTMSRPDDRRGNRPQPRPQPQPSGSGPGGPGRGRTATADPPPRPSPPPKQKKRGRTVRRVVLGLVALWVVFLIAVPFWAWGKLAKVDADPAGDRPADQPGTTYLLVGSDSRAGLSAEQRKKLGTGDAAGQRTDTIMLLHIGSGPNLLLSIPRDSLVPIPGHGTTKINAA
ncbi:MAG: cell envelope-related transcriptional attenuator, partial [Nocardioidaceae bacterium]|nr:cell envelope-related transcriptional attenuator [Nocardioidaceae bacterium]